MNINHRDEMMKELYRIHGLASLLELTDMDEYRQGVYKISAPLFTVADAIQECMGKCLKILNDKKTPS
ncbi:MAG: hypothetical protein CVU61_03730 [Deltaproteobacteria bacterium HGW-Deltaproteobacteria-19]|jgi:hypothetical protein|nr:MAG: hypothetical protein CVU61_03730 [Deltaproteobacteria bacterium HGW-Deltaproteobacteria-19]